ncbi:MAG: thioredoxin [Candidatus Hodarchaeales archaeon]
MSDTDQELEILKNSKMKQFIKEKSTKQTMKIPNGIIHLNDSNFINVIKNSKIPVFVDYWASWCRPCMMVGPTIEKLEKKFRGKMLFAKLNTDENRITSQRMKIFSIPTFHIFYQGKTIDSFVGALPESVFQNKIEKAIKKAGTD